MVWNVSTLTLDMQRESLQRLLVRDRRRLRARRDRDAAKRRRTTFTQNVWTAPTTPGPVYLWTVLRDDRGGVDFAPPKSTSRRRPASERAKVLGT